MNSIKDTLLKKFSSKTDDLPDVAKPLSVNEVTALLNYAAENGIDPDGNTLAELAKAVETIRQSQQPPTPADMGSILTLYAKLAQKTDNVNGRTLLGTEQADSNLKVKFSVTLFLVIIAISNEIMAAIFADMPDEFEGGMLYLVNFRAYILEYLSPFLWGAIGACVYLLKNLYDIAAARKFDSRKQHGWYMRVLLGAIIAGAVYYFFDFTGVVEEGKAVSGKAVAFLVGIGVKVVYGGLERLIVLISDKLNLTQVRRIQTNPAPAESRDDKKNRGEE
jgi:hypothetical protein